MEEQSENPVPWASAAAPVPVHCSAVFGVATSTRKALGSMEGASTVTGRVRDPSQSLLVMFLCGPLGRPRESVARSRLGFLARLCPAAERPFSGARPGYVIRRSMMTFDPRVRERRCHASENAQ